MTTYTRAVPATFFQLIYGCRKSLVMILLMAMFASVGSPTITGIRADDPLPGGDGPGEDPSPVDDDPLPGHPKPEIVGVEIYCDGADQFAIFGSVTNCDELSGMSITIGGAINASVTTDSNGEFQWFGEIEAGSGNHVYLTAICHEGESSEEVRATLP